MNIRISNLGQNITGESLKTLFETYGKVTSWSMLSNGFTGNATGTVFLEMPDTIEAAAAIAKIDGAIIDGRTIAVKESKPMTEQKSGPVQK